MISKKITYKDFTGTQRTEEFFFNISLPEALRWQNSADGGLGEKIQRMLDAKENRQIAQIYEDFILMSYGEIADDGKTFRKEDDFGNPLSRKFKQTAAYQELFFEMLDNQDEAVSFINGVIDPELMERINTLAKDNEENTSANNVLPMK